MSQRTIQYKWRQPNYMEPIKYPSMSQIAALWPAPQVFLGRRLYWTEKRDGSQLKVWANEDGTIGIATNHRDDASEQFKNYFWATQFSENVKKLVTDAESVEGIGDFGPYQVFGELLVKGKSPARFEMHDEHEFIVFDLYHIPSGKWIPTPVAHQTCYHFGVPFVEVWGESEHANLEDLYSFRDEMLVLAKDKGREGVVVKTLHEGQPLYAKEKLDTMPTERRSINHSAIQLPPLPDSEVFGAVAKAHADLGEEFFEKSKGMPLVATYVAEEGVKHLTGKPANPLFWYYQTYMEGLSDTMGRADDSPVA